VRGRGGKSGKAPSNKLRKSEAKPKPVSQKPVKMDMQPDGDAVPRRMATRSTDKVDLAFLIH
jgi:hypothetical protein